MKTAVPSIERLESRIAPATIVVTSNHDSGPGTLRAALALADDPLTHPGHDTIVFHFPSQDVIDGAVSIPVTSGVLTTKGNVTISGPGPGKLILNAVNDSGVLMIDDGNLLTDSPATITGLSIINGKTSGNGGGIYSYESLMLKNVVISGNSAAGGGGGVEVNHLGAGTKVNISNCLISANTAGTYSGGLDLFDLKSITISNTVVTGNTAVKSAGGINVQVDATQGTGIIITGCQISGNTATYGAGLTVDDHNTLSSSKTVIRGTKITGNTSNGTIGSHGGGGLYLQGGNAVIAGSTISNNTAVYYGGGIFANGFTSLKISNTTISGNQETGEAGISGGGGLFIEGNTSAPFLPVQINASRITDNSANDGGGLFAYKGLALTISGSTVSGNRSVEFGGGVDTFSGAGGNVDLTVIGGTFSNNVAVSSGGGIYADGAGAISISGARVIGNTAFGAGGISTDGATSVNITNLVAVDNFATAPGGGLEIGGTTGFHVTGGSIHGNEGFNGGGISLNDSSGSIKGVTIFDNVATNQGGGVFNGGNSPGLLTLQFDNIFDNTAPSYPNST